MSSICWFASFVTFLMVLDGAVGAQAIEEARDPEVVRIARLHGKAQQRALTIFLKRPPSGQYDFFDSLFYYESALRPALRPLASDRKLGIFVQVLLTEVGDPDDLRLIIQHPPRFKRTRDSANWADRVASSLLSASTEEEWNFLRSCAYGKYLGAESGAIQTLKLIASPRSRELLQEVESRNQQRSGQIQNALAYIQSEPPPLTSSNLEELTRRVAQTISALPWRSNRTQYNESRNVALVAIAFSRDLDLFFYQATFYKAQDKWTLRGVRQGGQALINATVPPTPPPEQ